MRVSDSVQDHLLWWTNNVDNFCPLLKGVSLMLFSIRCFKERVGGGMSRYYYWRYVDSR